MRSVSASPKTTKRGSGTAGMASRRGATRNASTGSSRGVRSAARARLRRSGGVGQVALGDVAQQGRLAHEADELVDDVDAVLRHARRGLAIDATGDAAGEDAQLLAREPAHEVEVDPQLVGPEPERIGVSGTPQRRPALDEPDGVTLDPLRAPARDDLDGADLLQPPDLPRRQAGPLGQLGYPCSGRAGTWIERSVDGPQRLRLGQRRRRLAVDQRLDGMKREIALALQLLHDRDALDEGFVVPGDVAAWTLGFRQQPFADVEPDGLPADAGRPLQVLHLEALRARHHVRATRRTSSRRASYSCATCSSRSLISLGSTSA